MLHFVHQHNAVFPLKGLFSPLLISKLWCTAFSTQHILAFKKKEKLSSNPGLNICSFHWDCISRARVNWFYHVQLLHSQCQGTMWASYPLEFGGSRGCPGSRSGLGWQDPSCLPQPQARQLGNTMAAPVLGTRYLSGDSWSQAEVSAHV